MGHVMSSFAMFASWHNAIENRFQKFVFLKKLLDIEKFIFFTPWFNILNRVNLFLIFYYMWKEMN